MTEIINDQRQSYRRGLILGLTVAEALLLILFGLLLALGSILVKHRRDAEAQSVRLNDAEMKLAGIEFMLPRIPIPRGKEPDDFFIELGTMKTENDALQAVNEDLKSRLVESDIASGIAAAAESSKQAADDLRSAAARGETLDDVFGEDFPIERVSDVLEIAKAIEESLPSGDGREDTIADLKALTEQLGDQVRENGNLRGQLANAERRLQQEGLGYLACWAMDVGTPDYLFDVALRGDGIQVRRGHRAERLADYKTLPIPAALLGRPLSDGEFIRLSRALFDYSETQNCRFFVRIFDLTAPDQKVAYKRRLQTVETHFYKYLVSNPATWGPEAAALINPRPVASRLVDSTDAAADDTP